MMPSISKIVAGIAGIGTLSGVAVGGFYAFSNSDNNINKQLVAKGFTLISTDEEFSALLVKYKSATKDVFTENKESISLKSKCQTILKEKPNESNYKLARKWCVKEENINKILEKGGYKVLNSTENIETDNTIWEQKVNLLKVNLDKFPAIKEKIKTVDSPTGNNVKELKKACRELALESTPTTNDKFGENFDLAEEFCAIKQN